MTRQPRPRHTWQRGELDRTLKALLLVSGQDLVDLVTRKRSIKFIQAIDKEIPIQSRRLDGLLLVEERGVRFLMHIEFKSRPDSAVAAQVARDGCLAHFLVRVKPDASRPRREGVFCKT